MILGRRCGDIGQGRRCGDILGRARGVWRYWYTLFLGELSPWGHKKDGSFSSLA